MNTLKGNHVISDNGRKTFRVTRKDLYKISKEFETYFPNLNENFVETEKTYNVTSIGKCVFGLKVSQVDKIKCAKTSASKTR